MTPRLLLVVLLLMTGCARTTTTILTWSGPEGVSREDFLHDRYTCIQEARRSKEGVIGDLYVACMSARGYTLNPRGPFGPPPGGAIQVQ